MRTFSSLFGLQGTVDRRQYGLVGVTAMVIKYLGEALVFLYSTGEWYSPLRFLSPLASFRLATQTDFFLFFQIAWSLPFLWILVSMSVRRCLDAKLSPWLGFIVVTPVVNYFAMVFLLFAPTKSCEEPVIETEQLNTLNVTCLGFLLTLGIALLATALAGFGLTGYSTGIFLSTPTLIAAFCAYLANREKTFSLSQTIGACWFLTALLLVSLTLFALEGVVCILMAAPLVLTGALVGAIFGRLLALHYRSNHLRSDILMVILIGGVDIGVRDLSWQPQLREVSTSIVVNAEPEQVWNSVIAFPPLEKPQEAIFQLGIAYPTEATINGSGIGAIRHCRFSTGSFVEPITLWNPPFELAFDVTEQPQSMKEFSPWGEIVPQHVFTIPQSERGRFKLKRNSDNTTTLTGTTWYRISMTPQIYWGLISDNIISTIHYRVLVHIKEFSEKSRNIR